MFGSRGCYISHSRLNSRGSVESDDCLLGRDNGQAAQDMMIIRQLIVAAPCGAQRDRGGTPNQFVAGDGVCVRCRETVQLGGASP